MRISEAFCKMRLSDYCTSQDVDRAIAVTVDSFVGAQKVSCKKALARAFAKYDPVPLQVNFDGKNRAHLLPCRYTLAKPNSQGRNGVRKGGGRSTAVAA